MKNASVIECVKGNALSLHGNDIDTDRIIPARFMRCVTFDGLGKYAFYDERFEGDGAAKKHPMNDPLRSKATIFLVGRNFGCGSSREHAPQSLAKWGVRALVGESFADIFAGNCASIGLPTVSVTPADLGDLRSAVEADVSASLMVDLVTKEVHFQGEELSFTVPCQIPPTRQHNFLAGTWDTLGSLLSMHSAIDITATRIPYLTGF